LQSINHPKSPDQITKEWMDYAFNEAGICNSGTISNIEVKPLGPHVKGLLSSLCRVKLNYDAYTQQLPNSVVIKFPSILEERKDFGNHFRAYEREIRFYREIAKNSPIRIPKCYFTVMEKETEDYILVIEDAGSWTPGDQLKGLTLKQTQSAVKEISKFHGYWWDSEKLSNLEWMPEENRDHIHSFKENWGDFSHEHREVLNDKDISAGDIIANSGQKIHDLGLITARTIIHYDFRADNMMFNDRDEILVLDWQVALRSLGAFDVVRAVCGSHHGLLESSHHLEFLEMWYEGLLQAGVTNYSREDAWRDYRISIIMSAYVPVVAHHFLSHEGTRGISIMHAMISRIFHAIHETDALELLE